MINYNSHSYPQPEVEYGIPMDKGTESMYQFLFNINPNECIRVNGNVRALDIRHRGKLKSLEDFLNTRTKIVSLDEFSTKKINKEFIKSLKEKGMPDDAEEIYSRFYLEIQRIFGLVEDKKQSIGIVQRVVYLQFFNSLNLFIFSLPFFVSDNFL